MDSSITRPLILAIAIPFPIAHILLGLANLGQLRTAVPALMAMAICLVLVVVVVRRGPAHRLNTRGAVTVVAGTTLMTVLVNLGLPIGVHPGYAAWHSGALQMLLVALALRQRSGFAWAGTGLFVLAQSVGSWLNGMSFLDAVVLMVTPVVWVVIANAVNSMLDRSRRDIESSSSKEREAELRLAHEYAAQVSRREWAADLDQRTRPTLELIANLEAGEGDRADFLLLEAELRDQIRGRALVAPGIAEAARGARSRGVRVELLDDLKQVLSPSIQQEVTHQLIAALGRTQAGFINARALSVGTEQLVRIVAFDEENPESELTLEIGTAKSTP